MFSRMKFPVFTLAIVTFLLLGLSAFFVYLTFFSTHDSVASQLSDKIIERAYVQDGLPFPVSTVIGHEAPGGSTRKNEESELNSRENVTSIIGRRPQRIKLPDSLRLDKIHMVIKTSVKFHHSRLELLLLTWLQTAHPSNVSICEVVLFLDVLCFATPVPRTSVFHTAIN